MQTLQKIRDGMADDLQKIRQKKYTPSEANAISNAVGKILGAANAEMTYAKASGKRPKMDDFIPGYEDAPAKK